LKACILKLILSVSTITDSPHAVMFRFESTVCDFSRLNLKTRDVHGNGIPRGNGIPWDSHGNGNVNDFRRSVNVGKCFVKKIPIDIKFEAE